MIILVGIVCLWKGKTATAFLVDSKIGNHTVYAGQNVTLTCDLNSIGGNRVLWFHNERFLFISKHETFYDTVPLNVRSRMSIVCSVYEESCSLTITNVTFEDGGTYRCGYDYQGGVDLITDGYLNVLPSPLPPSENSPVCTIFSSQTGMRSASDALPIGETILLSCSVDGTTTEPSLVWQRDNSNITDVKTTFILPSITLSNADVGAEFTCIMNYPALTQSRNCSVVPLPLTNSNVPNVPNKFQVGDVTKTSMTGSWDEPEYPNSVVTKYTVQAVVLEKLYDTSFTHTSSNPVLAVNEELDSQQRTKLIHLPI
ncbi:uncharacterized protein [Amphiura filiformis]|uniref:uncharacterized protein n=1 Tax=Amphiura filiformis TaxID=82378 RepID=UPI003B2124D8